MDLGVAADVLGNLLKMLQPKMGGANQEANCKLLFLRFQSWYREHSCESRLDNLTTKMIQKSANAPPKLRGKAAKVRNLVP